MKNICIMISSFLWVIDELIAQHPLHSNMDYEVAIFEVVE